jgi:DNA mismatch repair ATPase MutS
MQSRFENQLQSLSLDDQVDNLLLPLLFKHEPRFLVVCGNKEDTLLASLQKVSKKRFAAADYRPPQLIRLNHSEFHTPKCQARIRESMKIDRDSGNSIHTRCAIPSDCTIAIRSVGALIGFVKRANSYGPLRFEPLSLVTACGIGSNVLQYLRITAQRGHTETSLFSIFRSIKGIGLQKRLRKFLQTPVADIEIIKRRQAIFEFFTENGFLRRDLLLVCERFSVPKKIISAAGMSKTGHTVRKNHQFWSQVVTAVRNITEVQISRKSIPEQIKGLKISTIDEDLFKRIQNVGASIEELIDFDQSKRQKTVVLNSESTELGRVRRILLMEARIPSIIKHGQMDIDLLYAELGLKLRHMREIGFFLEKKFDGDMTDNGVQERFNLKQKLFGSFFTKCYQILLMT